MSQQQKSIISLIILFFSIISGNIIYGQTLLYKETSADKDFTREISVTKSDSGYLIEIKNADNDEMTYDTDPSFSVIKWRFRNPDNGTDISAERTGEFVSVTGSVKNKEFNEKLEIGDLPWYQEWGYGWGLGLSGFIFSDEKTKYFWRINPGNLSSNKYEARKETFDTLDIDGKKAECVIVKINMTGLFKFVWNGKLWFRKSDGMYVYSKMTKPAQGNFTTVQLIEGK
jgi:hypothetical protein